MKQTRLLVLVIAAILMFCSCSGFGINVDDSISPPKPSGELYEIQKALETSVGHSFNLVYPSSGRYRSAIITRDINADGKYEVFSFYSTETDDKVTVMHINYIRWLNEKWVSVTDLQLDCSGVESVDFVRLDKSSTPKILVNWDRYTATNKQLSVYSIDSGELVEVTKADYSVYTATDLNSDGISEIVAVHLDTEKKTSTAKLLALSENGFSEISVCPLDPSVTSYHTPTVSKFTNGMPAVFIDGVKASGMITEILYVKDGATLLSAVPFTANLENVNTLRASSIRSGDYDNDGSVDIPLNHKLPMVQSTAEEDSAYITVWNSFDGQQFTPIGYTVINYTDGYYISLPESWVDNIAVQRRVDARQRVFYRWDSATKEPGEEVIRVQVVPLKDWEHNSAAYEGYSEFARNSEDAYIIKFGNSALTPEKGFFKENFRLITPDNTEGSKKIF